MRDGEAQATAGAPDAARRKDRWIGLAIIVATFAATMGLSVWAKHRSRPETSGPPAPPTTEGLSGYPNAVDPIASLSVARELTRRRILRGISMEGVRADGTIDLAEGPGRARYAFQSLPGEGPQPARDVGTLPRHTYCGKQNVHLRQEGLVADPDVADYPCPGFQPDDLPEPHCTARDVWRHAIDKGAPRDRMARIEYYRASVGPAWRFELPGSQHHFSLYGDCGRELEPGEATGYVP